MNAQVLYKANILAQEEKRAGLAVNAESLRTALKKMVRL